MALQIILTVIGVVILILAVTEYFPDPDYPIRSTVIKLGRWEGFMLDDTQGNFWNYTVRFKKPLSS